MLSETTSIWIKGLGRVITVQTDHCRGPCAVWSSPIQSSLLLKQNRYTHRLCITIWDFWPSTIWPSGFFSHVANLPLRLALSSIYTDRLLPKTMFNIGIRAIHFLHCKGIKIVTLLRKFTRRWILLEKSVSPGVACWRYLSSVISQIVVLLSVSPGYG